MALVNQCGFDAGRTASSEPNQKLFDLLQFEADMQNTSRDKAHRPDLPFRAGAAHQKKYAISVRDSHLVEYTAARAQQNPSWRAPANRVYSQSFGVRTEMT